MLFQGQANEVVVGLDDGRTQWLSVDEVVQLKGVLNGIWMDSEFAGNGAHLPMLGIEVTANMGPGFGTNHERIGLLFGMGGKGSTNWPTRPQIRQRSHSRGGFCGRDVTDRGGRWTGV